ncbi:FAD-binding oxidoreductase [Halorarum halophilum]|uniref:FAD-binding oxidoreductase n=1 Tax=Halorarum halophilum TaxID=2743090 RepID=A0A7D5GIC9_9EURY|nr:FAD-binding oxidoreductase [Halobaculum halophilum]QLG28131.1 FAD-binding oxidoreductase [Halobaculum halophilum]
MNEYCRADAAAVARKHRAALDALAADLGEGTGSASATDLGGGVDAASATDLGDGADGQLVRPDDSTSDDGTPAYDEARTVWNGLVDRFPAAVAYARDAADVARILRTARETGLGVAVRSGAHSVAGTSVCDGGIVLDCGAMNRVAVDADAGTAVVGPGATWADLDGATAAASPTDLDAATAAHGFATPGGVVSDTGVAGLVLGGGTGWLTREAGLACDRLTRAEVVTAAGECVTATADRNPDLFRALRGGGGNFGVVVSFAFDLVPIPDELAVAETWYPLAEAPGLLAAYRDLLADAPPSTTVSPYVSRVPEGPAYPDAVAGDPGLCLLGVSTAPADRGANDLRAYRDLGEPLADRTTRPSYPELQSMLDDDSPAGDRYYWKSIAVDRLADDVIATFLDRARAAPGERDTALIWPLGGAVAELAPDETAFPRRDAAAVVNFEAAWSDPEADDEHVDWARDSVAAIRDLGGEGELPNFAGNETDDAAARAVFRDNYGWLRDAKTEWDPENVFGPSGRLSPW